MQHLEHEDDENCIVCNDPHYALCTYCGDSVCDVHALVLPAYRFLKACPECFEKNERPALAAITAFVAEAA